MMSSLKKSFVVLAAAVFALGLVVGCGGGGEDEAATGEKADAAAVEVAPAAIEVAVHDCDGACGMKDVQVDKMTVVDGKYDCAGCAKKAEEEDHSGHDHN